QHHLRPAPGHHRPAAPADDPHQPPSLVIVDLTHPHPFTHRPSLSDQYLREKTLARVHRPDALNPGSQAPSARGRTGLVKDGQQVAEHPSAVRVLTAVGPGNLLTPPGQQ